MVVNALKQLFSRTDCEKLLRESGKRMHSKRIMPHSEWKSRKSTRWLTNYVNFDMLSDNIVLPQWLVNGNFSETI